jgi:predicted amidohydrolase
MEPIIAVAQFAPTMDTAANLATIERLAAEAVAQGAGLVVLPEYASYYDKRPGPSFIRHAETLDGPFVRALESIAERLRIAIVAGLVEVSAQPGRFRNTLVAVIPVVGLVATYSKLHLYQSFGGDEARWIEPGAIEPPRTFQWGGFNVGLETCYDLRFPEVTRRLVDAGADLVLVPAAWVPGELKEHHWRTLLTARAIENTVYVAAAGQTAPSGIGVSLVIDPAGVPLVQLGDREGTAAAAIDPARVAEVRAVNPALAVRRFGTHPLP